MSALAVAVSRFAGKKNEKLERVRLSIASDVKDALKNGLSPEELHEIIQTAVVSEVVSS